MTLDRAFNADTLHVLRKVVQAEATAAGMPQDRAVEVTLAIHELAANAVRHGAGGGRLWMDTVAGQLLCHVSDAGAGSTDGRARGRGRGVRPWPVEPGHGLWLVRQVADHVSVATGPEGSKATAVFSLPGNGGNGARD